MLERAGSNNCEKMKPIHILFMILAVMNVSAVGRDLQSRPSGPPEKRCICIKIQKKAEREYKKMVRSSKDTVRRDAQFWRLLPIKWLSKRKNMFVRDNFSKVPNFGKVNANSFSSLIFTKK